MKSWKYIYEYIHNIKMDFGSLFIHMILYLIVTQSGVAIGKHIPTTITTTTTTAAIKTAAAAATTTTDQISYSKINIENVNKVNTTYPGAIEPMKKTSGGIEQDVVNGVDKSDQVASNSSTSRNITNRYKEPWELNYNICPPSLCIANEEQRPKGTGGSVFYNGDIVLDNELAKVIYSNMTSARYKRATTRNPRTWRNAIVPYMFASDIAPLSASVIGQAIRTIERETCIRFKRRHLRDEDYIRFISEPGCWSAVGRVGGEQKVSIGPECERLGIAIHEILHALGFWHEQARPDRDEYIQIIEENIDPKYIPDFQQTNKMLVTSRGFPYDYQSIMHYGNKAFTKYGEDTIQVIGIGKTLKMTIGQRVALSNIDIAQLRDMYKCFNKETFNTYCPKDWIKLGRKCYKFEDKQAETFAGAVTKCDAMKSKLVLPQGGTEEFNVKQYIKRAYPNIKVWRTGERIVNGSFVWYSGEVGGKINYTNWNDSYPATYSSFALLNGTRKRRSHRQGVWIDAFHACPYICEQRAKHKCILGNFTDGRDYRGTLDHTIDGYTCQKWSTQYPWTHSLLSFPDNGTENNQDGLGNHNFCRNPSGDRKDRPWCYTTKSNYKWQYCDVSICSKKESSTVFNHVNSQDGNLVTDRNTYKTFSVNSNNGRTPKKGLGGGKTIRNILFRKHNPEMKINNARNSRNPSFRRGKSSARKKNLRSAQKYSKHHRSSFDRRKSNRRRQRNTTKRRLKRNKH